MVIVHVHVDYAASCFTTRRFPRWRHRQYPKSRLTLERRRELKHKRSCPKVSLLAGYTGNIASLADLWHHYYEKGSSGNNFLRKEKFRTVLLKKDKTLKKIRRETVKLVVISGRRSLKLSRRDKADATKGTQSYVVNTDLQAELELDL